MPSRRTAAKAATAVTAATAAKPKSAAVNKVLTRTFGYRALRPDQAAVIDRVLAGEHTLAIMPTGAGKSLCYQLPALLLHGNTVVVSPLIALMKDQCDRLCSLGVAAVQLNSSLKADALRAAEAAIADGTARIVFVTPERLADADCLQLLQQRKTALLVVDEAHCISQWGHDFRPAFLEITQAWAALGRPATLALTATATPDVAKDIAAQLHVPARGIVNTGSYRPNLHCGVQLVTRDDEKLARAVEHVAAQSGSGIVYTATVKSAIEVHAALQDAGQSVGLYHGKLSAAQRNTVQDAFMSGALRVIVATNAFGLGIDKPDVRFVLHYQMPSGLDAYYQEAGRAGRDGAAASCNLLYMHGDKAVQQFFLANRYPQLEDLAGLYATLQKPPAGQAAWTLDSLQAAAPVSHGTGKPIGKSKLAVAVRLLRQQRIVDQNRSGTLRVLRAGLSSSALQALASIYQERREEDHALLEKMVAYAQTGYCRWKLLLDHLAAKPQDFVRCGTCDNCLRLATMAEAADQPTPVGLVNGTQAMDLDAQASQQIVVPARPSAMAAFASGQTVRVKRYGVGKVATADATSVTVEFDNGERRCFVPHYVSARVGRHRANASKETHE